MCDSLSAGDDPPMENLNPTLSDQSPGQGPEVDLLSGLLGSGAADSALGSWKLRVKTGMCHVDTTQI